MRHRLGRVALGIGLLATVGGACGGPGGSAELILPAPRVATLADLLGPWRAEPFVLDPAFVAAVGAACRREIEMGAGSQPTIIDARGARVVTVGMTGLESGRCRALEVLDSGAVAGAGGGWRGRRPADPVLAPGMLAGIEVDVITGGALETGGPSVHGRVGPGIVRVEIVTVDRGTVVATLQNGQFAAWWPHRDPAVAGDARSIRFTVRAYDVSGTVVAERHR
jgi:hypothetical protein